MAFAINATNERSAGERGPRLGTREIPPIPY
jgi:hypothetical protein